VDDLKLPPFIVRREADRWVFVPSRAFAGLKTLGFGAGSVCMILVFTMFFRGGGIPFNNSLFGPIIVLASAMLAVMAIRAWRLRRTPLAVEFGGRVSYGEQELCAAGTVRSVRIAEARGGEVGDCEVALEVDAGKLVFIPSPYFARFRTRDQARRFGSKLAELLAVQATESY
jgi:hypothetical protein